jgi:tripartite ATP-independent transporter DctM subunit
MILEATLVLFVVFLVLLLAGVPISVGIGVASIATALFRFDLDKLSYVASQRSFAGIDSFALLAIPFFMLAGNIMNKGGIAKRLVRLAKLVVSNVPGYLAHTNVLANMFFGAVSGSSVAATSAVGSIMAPIQEEEGYDPAFSAAVNICSAPTGIIIPPSGPLILYSLTAGGVSVSALFVAGYIPGILLGLAIMVASFYFAKKLGYTKPAEKENDPAIKIIVEAIPSLLMTVIVMVGILGGVFTATEAGVVAVIYCIVLAFLYREINLKSLYNIFADTMMSGATILFLISASSIMSYVMSFTGIPAAISALLLGISDNKYVLLLIINVFLLVLGMFLDLTPAVLIFTPIFLPVVTSFGMSPVHFGIMLILNLGIGSVTPPVGSCLFVGCGVAKVSIEKVTKYIVPIFAIMVAVLLLVTYIPGLSLFIPRLMGLI